MRLLRLKGCRSGKKLGIKMLEREDAWVTVRFRYGGCASMGEVMQVKRRVRKVSK